MPHPDALHLAEQLFRCAQVLRAVAMRLDVVDAADRTQLMAFILRIEQAVAKYGPVEISPDLRRTEP